MGKSEPNFISFLDDFLVVLETLNPDYGTVPRNKLLIRHQGQINCLTDEFLMEFLSEIRALHSWVESSSLAHCKATGLLIEWGLESFFVSSQFLFQHPLMQINLNSSCMCVWVCYVQMCLFGLLACRVIVNRTKLKITTWRRSCGPEELLKKNSI